MGTFFATHEAELYHYGRKGMKRGRHLPDVLDPTRALVGRFSPVKRSLNTMADFGKSQGPHKTSRDYSVEYRTRHRVAQRQEEAKREAERNAAKNSIARGYATKTASRAAASGAATGNAVRELNRQIGQERLRRSTAKAMDERGRRAYEKERTYQSETNKRIRDARYRLSTIDAANAEQKARKAAEDNRTQDSRTKQLQREARRTRENVADRRRAKRQYHQHIYAETTKAAQSGAVNAVAKNERERTKASTSRFEKQPKWKQNLERAKSQKAASENAERIRRKKQYTESQRRRHLEENRGRKSKRPY